MQNVSNAYKESMKSSLRERAYIKLSFGIFNREVQRNASVVPGNFARYSNGSKLFSDKTPTATYATLEENFTKVDGSMFFLPRGNEPASSDVLVSSDGYILTDINGVYLTPADVEGVMTLAETDVEYLDTGLVSRELVSDAVCEVNINFNVAATDFKGLTIDFGENYPVDFDIVGGGQTIEVRGNNASKFVTEEVIENATGLKLVFYQMKNPQSRLRIYSIQFGYGLAYDNTSVVSSTLESYVSPICADIPQIDFSVTVTNYDKYFNIDNPESAIHFLETGEEMEVFYGYQLPDTDEIEWIRGGRLLCSEWESDDTTATIKAQDIFRNLDGEYYKGTYDAEEVTYYDLAMDVLWEAGITDYYLDPCLDDLYTTNPLPRVPYKEALQIIANACRCVMSQTRDGRVEIKSFADDDSNVTDFTMTRNDMTSSPKAIKQERVKEVIVPCYTYQNGDKEESLLSEEMQVYAGREYTFLLNEPSYGFRATSDGNANGVTIIGSGSYYVKVAFTVSGTHKLEIFGYRHKVVERYATKTLSSKGSTVKWENPLISDMDMATALAEWLGEYYSSGIEYEYDMRGYPELDANDIIYQENDFIEGMQVNVYRHTISFGNSFSGKVTARRVGG